jgi:hypothetical protein
MIISFPTLNQGHGAFITSGWKQTAGKYEVTGWERVKFHRSAYTTLYSAATKLSVSDSCRK